jgi:hypothetical protein
MTPLVQIQVDPKEIARIVQKLIEATYGEDSNTVSLAALGLALIIQNPDITLTELTDGIEFVSNAVAMYLVPQDGERVN